MGWRPAGATKSCQSFPADVPAPRGRDFHPMDCVDYVVAAVRGQQTRLGASFN